jgi:hypothetical protein
VSDSRMQVMGELSGVFGMALRLGSGAILLELCTSDMLFYWS